MLSDASDPEVDIRAMQGLRDDHVSSSTSTQTPK